MMHTKGPRDTVVFPHGQFSRYFHVTELIGKVTTNELKNQMVSETRELISPFLPNTDFCCGTVDSSFILSVPVYTIFARKDKRNIPYLLTDLAADLHNGNICRFTIDAETEQQIRSLSEKVLNMPSRPLPVIIEDSSERFYLIIEGNKRLSALALACTKFTPLMFNAVVGCSTLSWNDILANYKMIPER